jgi:hypothetical protein
MHEGPSQYETVRPVKRVVLLGASNLSRGLPTAVRSAQQLLGSPLEILVAMGHGRSYGQDSSFFGKKICGILQSHLWEHLEQNNRAPTYALITDVGNDILYGVSVETILQWVAESIVRLQQQEAQVVLTDLPIGVIRRLGKVRFLLFRTLLFPACRLSLETIIGRAEALSQALWVLAKERNVPIIKAKSKWYGLDPIHVGRAHAAAAWAEILESWHDPQGVPVCQESASYSKSIADYFHRFAYSFRCVTRPSHTPIDCLCDGTTIAQF